MAAHRVQNLCPDFFAFWERARRLGLSYSGDCRPRTLAEARRFLAEHGPAPGLRAGDASP
ncbi:MAG TPA: hypothetical protein VG370_14515, partial [Chloroflexota bacterium]|nr:hypothetical protein [Chloroflexota bacterium]